MLFTEVTLLVHYVLLILQVLHNLELYLIEEEEKMMKADAECEYIVFYIICSVCFNKDLSVVPE